MELNGKSQIKYIAMCPAGVLNEAILTYFLKKRTNLSDSGFLARKQDSLRSK
jgi:hypothetical protein